MDWRVKATVQNLLAIAPFGNDLNNLLQIKVGGLHDFAAHVNGKVSDWVGMMGLITECSVSICEASTLEIGTGWFPTLPVCFWLAGAGPCITYDQNRQLQLDLTRRLVLGLDNQLERIAQAASVSIAAVRERYQAIGTDILSSCRIRYVAPGDACCTGLEDQSIDLVFSNSVLEHVTADSLRAMMQETRRILRPSGVVVHCVACNDHYAHFDRKISYINYLRYNEREWRRWNNRLQFQNRLRAPDFLRAAEKAGLRVIAARQHMRSGVETALTNLPVAPEFKKYTPAELAATTVNFVCRPSA